MACINCRLSTMLSMLSFVFAGDNDTRNMLPFCMDRIRTCCANVTTTFPDPEIAVLNRRLRELLNSMWETCIELSVAAVLNYVVSFIIK